MCHDIEDPTFDATAGATNPYAQVRPIHRPPRVPRRPRAALPLARDDRPRRRRSRSAPHPIDARRSSESEIARVAIDDPGADAEPGGWFDYSGDFDPDFTLEDLSHRALVVALQEVAVQTHLLAHAYLHCVASRWGAGEARANAPQVFTGTAGVAAPAGCRPCSASPATTPRRSPSSCRCTRSSNRATYVTPVIEVIDERTVRFALLRRTLLPRA